jgi:predicted nuclease with TOPRIM domain
MFKQKEKIVELQKELSELKSNLNMIEQEKILQARIEQHNLNQAIAEAISEEKNRNKRLEISLASYEAKVSMYEQAFKNLGFDVKSMKDILDQLVKGIIAKNQINVIK